MMDEKYTLHIYIFIFFFNKKTLNCLHRQSNVQQLLTLHLLTCSLVKFYVEKMVYAHLKKENKSYLVQLKILECRKSYYKVICKMLVSSTTILIYFWISAYISKSHVMHFLHGLWDLQFIADFEQH